MKNNKKQQINEPQKNQVPGIPCPNCGDFRIKLTIEDLLYAREIKCAVCGLILNINRSECKELMGLVQDLHIAAKNVEALRKQKM